MSANLSLLLSSFDARGTLSNSRVPDASQCLGHLFFNRVHDGLSNCVVGMSFLTDHSNKFAKHVIPAQKSHSYTNLPLILTTSIGILLTLQISLNHLF